jgi:hypothetical protein
VTQLECQLIQGERILIFSAGKKNHKERPTTGSFITEQPRRMGKALLK